MVLAYVVQLMKIIETKNYYIRFFVPDLEGQC